MIDEPQLRRKLERIEALFAGAGTAGERMAAAEAKERILARLRALAKESRPVEYRFSPGDPWARKLFCGLLRGGGGDDRAARCHHPRRAARLTRRRVPGMAAWQRRNWRSVRVAGTLES